MSYPIIAWAMDEGRQRKLPASVRHVLLVLADRANGAKFCWPSLPTIAADTGLSARTCHTAVHVLEAEKLVRLERRGRLTYYHILRPTNGLDGDPVQPEVVVERSELPPNAYIAPQPLQPLQGSILQPLQGSDTPEPQILATIAAIDPNSCNQQPSILAVVANKPVKKENQERKEGKKESVARGARLPTDWALSPGCRAFAEGKGLDPDAVAECFSDYWHAKAGQGACKLDWEATWRNWCRTEVARMPRHRAHAEKPGKLDHLIHSIMAFQPAGHA